MTCPVCAKEGKTARMQKTLDASGNEIWLCPLCGYSKIIKPKEDAKDNWTISKKQGMDRSTMGSPPFSDSELKQGFRKGK